MRKRLIIGASAVVVIGVAVYFLSQPKKGTVEWHKAEYLQVLRKMRNETFGARLRQFCTKVFGVRFPQDRAKLFHELQAARKALIKIGFLEEREFLVRRSPGMVMQKASSVEKAIPEERSRFTSLTTGNRTVIITAMPQDIALWAEAVRLAESAILAEWPRQPDATK